MKQVILFLFLVLIATSATPAFAYLDPGVGAMIAQAVIGGVAVVLVSMRARWAAVKTRLAALFGKPSGTDSSAANK